MSLPASDIQQALRISKAIQEYLENTGTVNVPSTQLYATLADKKLVERDNEHGHHFRLFLGKLHKAGMLNLIPQCKVVLRSSGKHEWTFNRAADRMPKRTAGEAPIAVAEQAAPNADQ